MRDPGCTDTAVVAAAPEGPSRAVGGPGWGGSGRALTMLAAAVAHLLCPNRRGSARPTRPAAALYRGWHPRSGAGGPAYPICINLHRSAYIFCVRLFR